MNDFTFQNSTKVYFGRNQLTHLGEEIRKCGSRVLLVYGGGSIKRSGLYDRVTAVLNDAGIKVYELSGVEPNPRHTTVNKGAALCKQEKIEAVLGVGGGSTIDCSKAVAAATLYEGSDVWDLVSGKAAITGALPVFAIPTIASTGSEMDKSCVISNTETDEKRGMSSECLRPHVSFLDPTNTFTVSKYQTACGGFDIISHFLDLNYFTRAERYGLQEGVIESVMRTVVKSIPIALEQPDHYEARANLLWAASWALNSFCTSGQAQGASCHSMEHELSACYDLTHGLGLATLTPRWMEYLLERDATVAVDFKRFGVNVLDCDPTLNDTEGAKAATAALKDFLYQKLELRSTLTEVGIDDKRFSEMAEKACGKNGVIRGYRDLTPSDVETIYRMCL
jgi:alcohol dehydrogenase YqhD (iron-dependent ADH family)